jgi:type IV fimbrial biogenesis protein FimT
MRRQPGGFSLYELLMTLALAALLVSIGLPSFSSLLARSRQAAEINALFHAFHLARKQSIMRRQVVSLCPSRDGKSCLAGKDWSPGWIMFENSDRDSPPRVDPGEVIVRAHDVADSVRIMANREGFTLRATFKRATNGTFIICDTQNRVAARGLIVSYTGRPRVAFARPDGRAYSCAD